MSTADRFEKANEILASAQAQLEAIGMKCILSPTSLPQGFTVALIARETELSAAGAHVALSVGGESAHTIDGSTQFAHQVAQLLADFAIVRAGR